MEELGFEHTDPVLKALLTASTSPSHAVDFLSTNSILRPLRSLGSEHPARAVPCLLLKVNPACVAANLPQMGSFEGGQARDLCSQPHKWNTEGRELRQC